MTFQKWFALSPIVINCTWYYYILEEKKQVWMTRSENYFKFDLSVSRLSVETENGLSNIQYRIASPSQYEDVVRSF